jgi:hypothetical protein
MSNTEKTAVRPKFDAQFLKAILFRLMSEPHLCVKFRDYLDPDMFEINGANLKRIASILFDWIDMEEQAPTVDGIWGKLQLLPDGQDRDTALSDFNNMKTDKDVVRLSQSDQVFDTFLQWLKATAFICEYHGVRENFNSGSFETAYNKMELALNRIKGISVEEVDSADWDSSLDFLESESKRVDAKFNLGVDDFDSASAFEQQMLVIFVALTGHGKTAMTIHLIRQAVEQGRRIYVACVEDRKVTILRRVYSALTGIPMNEIKRLCDMPPAHRTLMEEARIKLQKFVTIDFIYGQPLDYILSRIKEKMAVQRLNNQPVFEIVALDYLQHIAHLSPGDSVHEKVTTSMAKFKDFALSNNLCCITHQQVNRSGAQSQNKEGLITLSEMSSSFQAAFVADVIISINRTPEMIEKDEAVLFVAKGREGATDRRYLVKTDFAKARYVMEGYTRLDRMA